MLPFRSSSVICHFGMSSRQCHVATRPSSDLVSAHANYLGCPHFLLQCSAERSTALRDKILARYRRGFHLCWDPLYPRLHSELGKRSAIFTCSGLAGTLFSGVLQAAVYQHLGGIDRRSGWRWLCATCLLPSLYAIPMMV